MSNNLVAIIQTTIMLAVDAVLLGMVCNIKELFGVLIQLAALVDLQLHAHIEIVFGAIEYGIRLVGIWVNRTLPQLLKAACAVGAVRVIIVVIVIGGNQRSAFIAGGVAVLITSGTKNQRAVPLGIIPTDSSGAAVAENGEIVQTILAVNLPVEFVGFIRGQSCPAFRADVGGIFLDLLIGVVGVFIHVFILLKVCFGFDWFLLGRIIYKQKNKACAVCIQLKRTV
jgi:hypothetical protein